MGIRSYAGRPVSMPSTEIARRVPSADSATWNMMGASANSVDRRRFVGGDQLWQVIRCFMNIFHELLLKHFKQADADSVVKELSHDS